MAKVIFEFTDCEAEPAQASGCFTVPVCIAVDIEGFSEQRPDHAECLALIMKKEAHAIIRAINEAYVAKLEASGAGSVSSALIKVSLQ